MSNEDLPLFQGNGSEPEPEVIQDYEVPKHVRDSDTSTAAALRVAPRYGSIQRRILAYIEVREKTTKKGATCDEIEEALGMLHQSASGALVALEEKGWVYASEARRTNRQGNPAQVYRPGIGPKFRGAAKARPRAAYRRGQRVWYSFTERVGDEAHHYSGQGRITHKIETEGILRYVVNGRFVVSEEELTKG